MVDKLVKFLQKQDKKIAQKVLDLIEKILKGDLEGCDIKKLKGRQELYRLRKGRIRIILSKEGEKFKVKKITFRDNQTYQDL